MIITTGVELGVLIDTTNTSVAPSVTLAFAIANTGKPLLSIIVPVPLAAIFTVFVLFTVAFRTIISDGSLIISVLAETNTITLVSPAGIVTVAVVVG